MRIRTMALGLALAFGLTAMAEAANKPAVHHMKKPKVKKSHAVKARKMKRNKLAHH